VAFSTEPPARSYGAVFSVRYGDRVRPGSSTQKETEVTPSSGPVKIRTEPSTVAPASGTAADRSALLLTQRSYCPGAARTERSTRTVAATCPSAVTVTAAECGPGGRPAGSAVSSRSSGVVPVAGSTVSHGADEVTLAVVGSAPEVTSTVRTRGGPSASVTSWSSAGAAVSVGVTAPVVNVASTWTCVPSARSTSAEIVCSPALTLPGSHGSAESSL